MVLLMPEYDEDKLKDKLKKIEDDYEEVEDVNFWATVFKRVLFIIVAFFLYALARSTARHLF